MSLSPCQYVTHCATNWDALRSELSWTHCRLLLSVDYVKNYAIRDFLEEGQA